MLEQFKKIPNQITLVRIVLLPFMWYFALQRSLIILFVLFVIASLSDLVDGVVARKLKQASEFGAKFDSVADNLLTVSAAIWLFLLFPGILEPYYYFLAGIALLGIAVVLIKFIKFGRIIALHTTLAKITTATVFIFFSSVLVFGFSKAFFTVLLIIGYAAIMEELFVLIIANKSNIGTIKKAL